MNHQFNHTKTILTITDDNSVRQLLQEQLEGGGYAVLSAGNGNEGLVAVSENSVALVIVDLLPETGGVEFCQSVRSGGVANDLPIIVLIDDEKSMDAVNPFAIGADDYLKKPINPSGLEGRVAQCLSRRERFSHLESRIRDGEILLEIAKSVNSTLDTGEILKQIVHRVASVLDDIFRCSILFVRKNMEIANVVASSDAHDFKPISIELEKYPEIQEALTTSRPVVIDDVATNPLLEPVRGSLDTDVFNTSIVLPVIYKKEIIGAMMVKALRPKAGVREDEVRFCELVANVAAGALQHAESFRQYQDETASLKLNQTQIEQELSVKAVYELLFENASDGLMAIDSDQQILFVNRRAMEISGYTREELQKRTFLSLLEPDSRDRFAASLAAQKTLITRTQRFDAVINKGDGGQSVLSVSLGEKAHASDLQVLSFRDVTGRRRIEKQLAETSTALEKANQRLLNMDKARTEFYNTAAHELRTPVAVVNGYCELLLLSDRDNLNEKQKDYLDQIGRSGDRLIDLIHNLLDLSRFEAGKMPLDLEEGDLSDLIRDIGNEVRSLVDTKGLTIEIHSGPLTMLHYDPILIRRLLMNLVGNAVKFTAQGGRVSIVLQEDAKEVKVTVSDTGKGISENDQEHLFKEFSQLSKSTGPDGTGLGLSICKKIVEAHNGEIWVKSKPGEGSQFVFSIPKSLVA
ncbi:MAG: hypothetical protein C0623_12345 [Desulfuromonas sp.]|nr:MAG: hypothetical protein C0623_12345 [Desulfuromonas sp.]